MNTGEKTNPYRERIINGIPKLLTLTAFFTLCLGLILPFFVKSQLLALIGWGISWAISDQLINTIEALNYNQDHTLWHQKEWLRKTRLWLAVIPYNLALLTEVGRVLDKLPLDFLKWYDNYSGTLCLAVLSFLIYRLGNVLQPSKIANHMARIEADVKAMRSLTHITTHPNQENTDKQASAEQAAAEQVAAEQAADEQAAAEQAATAKKTMLLHRISTVAGIAATAAITAAVILWSEKKENKE